MRAVRARRDARLHVDHPTDCRRTRAASRRGPGRKGSRRGCLGLRHAGPQVRAADLQDCAAHHAKPRRRRRRDAGRVSQGVREARSVSGELEVLHMAGSNCGQREPDAAAQAAHGQNGLDRRGRARPKRAAFPATWPTGRPNPEQNYTQAELAEILRKPFRACRRAFAWSLCCATWKDFPPKRPPRRWA
jgi:hypothetical protein